MRLPLVAKNCASSCATPQNSPTRSVPASTSSPARTTTPRSSIGPSPARTPSSGWLRQTRGRRVWTPRTPGSPAPPQRRSRPTRWGTWSASRRSAVAHLSPVAPDMSRRRWPWTTSSRVQAWPTARSRTLLSWTTCCGRWLRSATTACSPTPSPPTAVHRRPPPRTSPRPPPACCSTAHGRGRARFRCWAPRTFRRTTWRAS